jgi:hypothetical protein
VIDSATAVAVSGTLPKARVAMPPHTENGRWALAAGVRTRYAGKTAGRDAVLAKSTYVSLLGVEGASAEAERLVEQAVARLQHTGLASEPLADLAGFIITRTH